jgi:protein-disulfide isomerase
MKRSALFAIAIVALIAVGAGGYYASQSEPETAADAATGAESSPDAQVDVATLLQPGPLPEQALGEATAPVTVVEYASLSCSHCQEFHEKTFPEVKKRLIDTGKVRFVFRDFPLDQFALAGAMIARCAGDEKYFPIVDAFFAQQDSLLGAQDPLAWLQNFGKQVGFTQEQLEACLSNRELEDNLLKVRETASGKFGVNSTPTFFFNGKVRRGALTIEDFEKEVGALTN